VVSIDPYDGYRQAIRAAFAARPDRLRPPSRRPGANTALDAVRRERQRQAKARRTEGGAPQRQHAAWRPELYRARHRLLQARERLSERERRRLSELFDNEPLIAEAWWLKVSFRASYHASDRAEAERRLDAFLANGIRLWRDELLGLLRRAGHQRLRRRRHQQGQGHQRRAH
jgi:hypothetical protein